MSNEVYYNPHKYVLGRMNEYHLVCPECKHLIKCYITPKGQGQLRGVAAVEKHNKNCEGRKDGKV